MIITTTIQIQTLTLLLYIIRTMRGDAVFSECIQTTIRSRHIQLIICKIYIS